MAYETVRRRIAPPPLSKRGKGRKPLIPRCCKCGEEDPSKFYGHKTSICGKCHSEYTLSRGREQRAFAIEYLGGGCKACGFNKWPCSLDIHHTNPSVKDSQFVNARCWSRERLIGEMQSCILLCRNCHAAFHSGFDIYGVSVGGIL